MIKLLADEHIDSRIISGLLLIKPDLDIVTVHDVGLRTEDDPTILAWAAEHSRVLLTRDVSSMPDFAYERVANGQPMPGLIAFRADLQIGQVIDGVLTTIGASFPDEWEGRVHRLPI